MIDGEEIFVFLTPFKMATSSITLPVEFCLCLALINDFTYFGYEITLFGRLDVIQKISFFRSLYICAHLELEIILLN